MTMYWALFIINALLFCWGLFIAIERGLDRLGTVAMCFNLVAAVSCLYVIIEDRGEKSDG